MEEQMYLMPTYSKVSSSFTGGGVVYNASFHIAREVEHELRPLCGTVNVEGPAMPFLRTDLPLGLCRRCKQLAKLS